MHLSPEPATPPLTEEAAWENLHERFRWHCAGILRRMRRLGHVKSATADYRQSYEHFCRCSFFLKETASRIVRKLVRDDLLWLFDLPDLELQTRYPRTYGALKQYVAANPDDIILECHARATARGESR